MLSEKREGKTIIHCVMAHVISDVTMSKTNNFFWSVVPNKPVHSGTVVGVGVMYKASPLSKDLCLLNSNN